MKKVYLAAVAGNLGMLSIGQFFGWASPSLPVLIQNKDATYPVHLTSDEGSWVAALLMLGATIGAITFAFIVNTIGRKNTMLLAAVPSIISWLMIAFATLPWELYISRFISGFAAGIAYSATPMYLGEISPPKTRGILISMLTVATKLGATFEYMIGPFLSVKTLALISLAAPCLFGVVFIWVPESPYQLMRRNGKQKAIQSLVQLRGEKDVYKEADDIEQFVKVDLANEAGFRELLLVPGNRRALITLICMGIFQQMSGSQAVLQYAEIIFDEANGSLEGKYLTMILGVVQVVCTIICMFVTDYCGRKLLLIVSSIGASCSTAIVATYFTLQHHMDISKIAWLPAIGVLMYIVMYCLGLASLVFTMGGELFPTNVKALGLMMPIVMGNIIAFIVTKSYAVIAANIGVHVPFWIFSASSFVSALFTFFYVPETKGKTLEQIQEKLHMPPKQ
ncbi:facilitated trehalose transporter Tret1-like [Pseudomyrmex gracilis]|uniref:facilitated trehalose transporter Tret1-like n=1 Tax=Pseudomyrmex gracilis TaxID=219809 RepID=UPI00099576E0|nr:facilitated trehalose transporter Tret1-like [Pseudomyrmex gracilis]